MAATRSATLTTTMRVIDRVHGNTADVRAEAQPTGTTSLTEADVLLVGIRHGADGGHAFATDHPQLAGSETQLSVALVLTDQLDVGAGGASHLATLASLQLDIMNNGAHRNILQRQGIARLNVDALAGAI